MFRVPYTVYFLPDTVYYFIKIKISIPNTINNK